MAEVIPFVPAVGDWWPDTKEEWRAVSLRARPDLTDEQFDKFWCGFQALKRRRRALRRALAQEAHRN